MAKFDFSLVGGLPKKDVSEEPKEKLSLEEIKKRLDVLNKRHEKLIALPDKVFISKEVTEELIKIHNETLELIRMMLS